LTPMSVSELIPVLQMAIGPVVLISGVGLLISSLTNRMGRVVDRGRQLMGSLHEASQDEKTIIAGQLKILSCRAGLLRRAILFAVLCMLFDALLIITTFLIAAMKMEMGWAIAVLFAAALFSLIISLVTFLQELNQALIIFRQDIGE
jgi:hypothetical protein